MQKVFIAIALALMAAAPAQAGSPWREAMEVTVYAAEPGTSDQCALSYAEAADVYVEILAYDPVTWQHRIVARGVGQARAWVPAPWKLTYRVARQGALLCYVEESTYQTLSGYVITRVEVHLLEADGG